MCVIIVSSPTEKRPFRLTVNTDEVVITELGHRVQSFNWDRSMEPLSETASHSSAATERLKRRLQSTLMILTLY